MKQFRRQDVCEQARLDSPSFFVSALVSQLFASCLLSCFSPVFICSLYFSISLPTFHSSSLYCWSGTAVYVCVCTSIYGWRVLLTMSSITGARFPSHHRNLNKLLPLARAYTHTHTCEFLAGCFGGTRQSILSPTTPLCFIVSYWLGVLHAFPFLCSSEKPLLLLLLPLLPSVLTLTGRRPAGFECDSAGKSVSCHHSFYWRLPRQQNTKLIIAFTLNGFWP